MKTLTAVEAGETISAEPNQTAQIKQRETLSRVLRFVETLSKSQQEVVRLKFQSDLSYRDIAAITGLSVTNVGYLLHTAIQKLRERMQEDE